MTETQLPLRHDEPTPSVLASTEEAVLYPTFGHLSPDGREWLIGVSGVLFRPGPENLRQRLAMRIMRRLLHVEPGELEQQADRFRQRVGCFLAITQRGRKIAVRIGKQLYWLARPTRRNGHFRDAIRIPREEADELRSTGLGESEWLSLQLPTSADDPRQISGAAQLIGPQGVSVISDIDDTIKESEVADRRRLLRNTFLHEFEPVEGMSEVYRGWAEQGAAFHYVSSSPWQLFNGLHELLERAAFPLGSFHLKTIRLRDPSILRLFVARRTIKAKWIRSLIRLFPQRSFVLVGDSGEKDPEIYGAMARRFPQQVQQILIRRVPGRSTERERFERAFRELDQSLWRVIDHADELRSIHLTERLLHPS